MVILTVILCMIVSILCYLYNILILKQKKIRRALEIQGINGPSPSLLLGNIPEMKHIQSLNTKQKIITCSGGDSDVDDVVHDWPSRLFPYFYQWRERYGPTFLYSTGDIQMLFIADPDLLKEMNLCNSLDLGRPSFLSEERGPLFGNGVLSSSGAIWAYQKKLIAPAFYPDKVKDMVILMVECTNITIKIWEETISARGGSAEIIIDDDLRNLSGDIISKACFGSSYSEGKEIFSLLRTLQGVMSRSGIFIGIPGLRHLPTKNNRELWRLEKKINTMILDTVNNQRSNNEHEKNLLQMLLEAAKNNVVDSTNLPGDTIKADKFIVDNCKTIYFAGHETTATTATWVLMLLAANQDWQTCVRAEVLEVMGDGRTLQSDMLRSMKNLTMVIQETLRLYPPAYLIVRKVQKDIKLGNIVLPKGINVSVSIAMLHYDTELWGEDVHKFKPERFSNGVLGACKSAQGYLPFGQGARLCLGQHFGMVELKVVLAMILSKFCFSVAPTYQHSPAFKLVIQPEFGVNLIVTRV